MLLGIAHLVEITMPFLRLVILARLIPPDEFAVAIAIMLVFSIAEMATDVGLQQGVVRLRPSDARALDTFHALALVRGVVIGLAIIGSAPFNAWLFDREYAVWAFAAPGALFMLRGLCNLGIKQAARSFRFGPDAVTMIGAQSAWTVATALGALSLHDHRSMIVGLSAYVVTYVILSHCVSPERWRLGWRREVVVEAWSFGRPLLPNGAALAVTNMGDRYVVGAQIGLQALALYTPVIMMAMLPRGTLLRYFNNLLMPSFVARIEAGRSLDDLVRLWSRMLVLLGLGLALGIAVLGPQAVSVIYGAKLAPPPAVVAIVAALVFVRMLLGLPVPAALASGRTSFVLLGTLVTAASLAPAALSLHVSARLDLFVGMLLGFETLALGFITWRFVRSFGLDGVPLLGDMALASVLVAVVALSAGLELMQLPAQVALATAAFVLGFVVLGGRQVFVAARGGFKPVSGGD